MFSCWPDLNTKLRRSGRGSFEGQLWQLFSIIAPEYDEPCNLTGAFMGGYTLAEAVETHCTDGNSEGDEAAYRD